MWQGCLCGRFRAVELCGIHYLTLGAAQGAGAEGLPGTGTSSGPSGESRGGHRAALRAPWQGWNGIILKVPSQPNQEFSTPAELCPCC